MLPFGESYRRRRLPVSGSTVPSFSPIDRVSTGVSFSALVTWSHPSDKNSQSSEIEKTTNTSSATRDESFSSENDNPGIERSEAIGISKYPFISMFLTVASGKNKKPFVNCVSTLCVPFILSVNLKCGLSDSLGCKTAYVQKPNQSVIANRALQYAHHTYFAE